MYVLLLLLFDIVNCQKFYYYIMIILVINISNNFYLFLYTHSGITVLNVYNLFFFFFLKKKIKNIFYKNGLNLLWWWWFYSFFLLIFFFLFPDFLLGPRPPSRLPLPLPLRSGANLLFFS